MSQAAACDHGTPHQHEFAPIEVIERAARLLRAAGDPGRLRILEILATGEHCVSELTNESGDSMSTVSQRLRVLRSEGLVSRQRSGKHQNYQLADDHVRDLLHVVLEHAGETPSEGT